MILCACVLPRMLYHIKGTNHDFGELDFYFESRWCNDVKR